jgi:hypothetical protein
MEAQIMSVDEVYQEHYVRLFFFFLSIHRKNISFA